MRTTVGRQGRTVIPAELRRRFGLEEGSQIEWVDTIAALRGIGRGEKLVERLLAARRVDRMRA